MSTALTLAAFLHLAPQCAPSVHPDTLAAVVQTESRFQLYSINVNQAGRSIASRRFGSAAEAVAAVEELLRQGIDNIDLGPAQINLRAGHLQRRGKSVADAFSPCTALSISADVLVDCWTRAPSRDEQTRLDDTLSCYNTGGFERGRTNGYVRLVRASAERVVPALRTAAGPSPSPASPTPSPVAPAPAEPSCAPSWDAWAQATCERPARRAAPSTTTKPTSEPQ